MSYYVIRILRTYLKFDTLKATDIFDKVMKFQANSLNALGDMMLFIRPGVVGDPIGMVKVKHKQMTCPITSFVFYVHI